MNKFTYMYSNRELFLLTQGAQISEDVVTVTASGSNGEEQMSKNS